MWKMKFFLFLEFAKKIPALSSRFIPNFSPHCTSLENEIDETNELQHELSKNEEFVRWEPINISYGNI